MPSLVTATLDSPSLTFPSPSSTTAAAPDATARGARHSTAARRPASGGGQQHATPPATCNAIASLTSSLALSLSLLDRNTSCSLAHHASAGQQEEEEHAF